MRMKRIISAALLAATSLMSVSAEAPRYIFYFIGDGMGMAQALSAQMYNLTVRNSQEPLLMMQFPVAGQATTYSASSPVTDSAASGTALAAGVKTSNGMLGMAPDTTAVTSIARTLADEGYGIALVTSVPPDDATPGAFYAHVPSRSMYYEVGCQMAESGYDFIAGSRLRGLKDKKGQPTDLPERFAANGVAIVHGLDSADLTGSRKVLLLNPRAVNCSQIHYTIDSVAEAMTLPAMTSAALRHLQRNGRDRFFMMVEGGNIDYGGHANDGGTIVKEVINFNQALREAYDWYLAHPDETLIVVTADHETGGMALGNNTVGYNLHLKYLDYQKISKDRFADWCKDRSRVRTPLDWVDMQDFLRRKMGFWENVPVTDEQTARLKEAFEKCFVNNEGVDKKTLYNNFNEFTELVYRTMDSVTGLGFTTNGHSGGLVPVYAVGKGAERFSGMNDNSTIPAKIISDLHL